MLVGLGLSPSLKVPSLVAIFGLLIIAKRFSLIDLLIAPLRPFALLLDDYEGRLSSYIIIINGGIN